MVVTRQKIFLLSKDLRFKQMKLILLGVLYSCKALALHIMCNHQLAAKLLCNIAGIYLVNGST